MGVAEGGPLGGAVATITASLQLLHLVRDKPRQTGLLCTVLHLPYLLRMRRKITAHLTFIYCTKLMYGVKGAGRWAGQWAGRWPRSPPACSCCTRHCVTWRRDKAVLTMLNRIDLNLVGEEVSS